MNSLPDDLGPRLRDSLNHGAAPELSTDVVTGAADRKAPKLTNPRTRVQAIAGAAVLVAAIAVGAIVVGSGVSRPALFTEASTSSANGAAPAAIPAHGLFRLWADYVYHPGADLSTSGGSGDVYRLTRSGSGSDRIAALAKTLGMPSGSATVDKSDHANPLWTLGPTDPASTKPSLQLTWSGAGDWWYSDPSADPVVVCPPTPGSTDGSGATSSSSSGATAPDCTVTTQTPAADKAPTGADARSKARALFSETGLDVSASDIQLTSDSTQTTATASLEVGGVKTAVEWGVTWSSTGQISSAYGDSVTAVDRGSYGTISASDAVARLSDSQWSGTASPQYRARIVPFAMLNGGVRNGTVTAPTSGSNASGSSDGSAPAPTPTATIEPAPVTLPTPIPAPTDIPTTTPTSSPTPEPTPTGPPIINVTVNTAKSTLLLVWDSKGNAWLVPGYAMRVEQQQWDAVVSLVPGVIQFPRAATATPGVVEP